MPGGSFQRGGGDDRGEERKRMPSVLRGGPVAKSHYVDNPYRGRGSAPSRGRGVHRGRGRGGQSFDDSRREYPSPHHKDRRASPGLQQPSSSSDRRPLHEYPSYSSGPSHHTRENYDPRYNSRPSHETGRERYSPARYSDYQHPERDREYFQSISSEDRHRRRSPPRDERYLDRRSPLIDSRVTHASRRSPVANHRSPTFDHRATSPRLDRRASPARQERRISTDVRSEDRRSRSARPNVRSRSPVTRRSPSATSRLERRPSPRVERSVPRRDHRDVSPKRSSEQVQAPLPPQISRPSYSIETVAPTPVVDDIADVLPSSLPRPAGSALPRLPPTESLSHSPTPSTSRHEQRNRTPTEQLDDYASSTYDISQPSLTTRKYAPHHQQLRGRNRGGPRGGRGRGASTLSYNHREGALKRLGPKMRVMQRLGAITRGNGHYQHHRQSFGSGSADVAEDLGMQITIRADQSSSNRDVNNDSVTLSEPETVTTNRRNKLVKIQCPHCDLKTITFHDYANHLRSRIHMTAMTSLFGRLKRELGQMRLKQRREQKVIEARLEEEGKLIGPDGDKVSSNYCKTCKLIYHEDKEEHVKTEMHDEITNFLFPVCTVCNTEFFEPLAYQKHLATITHVRNDAFERLNNDKAAESDPNETADDMPEFVEGDFLTLDEVGEVDALASGDEELDDFNEDISDADENFNDDVSDSKVEIEEETELDENKNVDESERHIEEETNGEEETDEAKEELDTSDQQVETKTVLKTEEQVEPERKKKITTPIKFESSSSSLEKRSPIKIETKLVKPEVFPKPIEVDPSKPVGEDYVRKVEMFYCDLCHKYLPRVSSRDVGAPENSVAVHCVTLYHQNMYAMKRAEEMEEEERALRDLANHEVEGIEEEECVKESKEDQGNADDADGEVDGDDTLIISTKMEDEDQLDYDGEANISDF